MSSPPDVYGFRRFLSLEFRDKRIFLSAVALLAATGLGLKLLGFKRIRATLLQRPAGINTPSDLDAERQQALHTAFLVSAAARHGLYDAPCLPSAMTLQHLLRRQGIETALRFGVRKESDKLDAHAWVEHRGLPLIDGPEVHERYRAFEGAMHKGEEH